MRASAEEFQPDGIVLVGTHTFGTPHADSDVVLVVVTQAGDPENRAY
jgi:hypothetical protein